MSKRSFGLLSLIVTGLFVFAACADPQQPTATTVPVNPTPAGEAPTATPSGSETPQATATPFEPDPDAGMQLFQTNCTSCHNTTSAPLVGPGLAGVEERAATRVDGQSADEYLTNSIRNPSDYVVDSFQPIMPQLTQLSDADVQNLVAYLKTLE